jgi:pimeloyl-ACP methyl ester carboxylesterase
VISRCWLAYQNGLGHMQAASSFAGTETRGQLDFSARYNYKSSPAVVARGMLGMLHWDATEVLPNVRVPVLTIAGDQDSTTLPNASERMQKEISAAELKVIHQGAHLGVLEQNEQYDREIARFADRCLGGTSGPSP